MNENGKEPGGCAKNQSKSIASLLFANVALRYANGRPRFCNTERQQRKGQNDKSRAGDSPIGEGIQNIVMDQVGLQLHEFRPKSAEPAVKMGGTNTPPGIFAPHSNGGIPQIKADTVLDLSALGIHRLFGALLEELTFGPKISDGPNDQHERNKGGKTMRPLESKNGEKNNQRQCSREPASARNSDGDASKNYQRGVGDKNFRDVIETAGESVGETEGEQHFEKSSQMIWTDVSAGAAMGIGFDRKPDAI